MSEALDHSQIHVARSRKEPGCLTHDVYRDPENPQRLIFVEQWSDQAALNQHFKVPASGEFVKALKALAAGSPSMSIFNAEKVPA